MRGCICSFVVWLQAVSWPLSPAPRCTPAVASCTAGWGMCVTSWPLSWATEGWRPRPIMQVPESASLTGWENWTLPPGLGLPRKKLSGMPCTLCDAHTPGLWGKCRPFTTVAFPCFQNCWFCWIFHGLNITTAFIPGGELDFFLWNKNSCCWLLLAPRPV